MLMGVTSWELGVLRVPLIMVPDTVGLTCRSRFPHPRPLPHLPLPAQPYLSASRHSLARPLPLIRGPRLSASTTCAHAMHFAPMSHAEAAIASPLTISSSPHPMLGAFVCRRSSKTCLTIGYQHVVKYCRSFGTRTPLVWTMEGRRG
jgi:hypothetical protein